MKVKCIANSKTSLPQNLEYEECYCSDLGVFPVSVDVEYTVYAIFIAGGYPWYYIEEPTRNELIVCPAPLFQVIDNRLSQYWIFSLVKSTHYEFPRSIFAFPEWAEDSEFYKKIKNHFEREQDIYTNYKILMDFEFPDSSINAHATIIDDFWIQCSKCSDAWESNTDAGKIICPSCKTILNNPRYQYKPTHLKAWLNNES